MLRRGARVAQCVRQSMAIPGGGPGPSSSCGGALEAAAAALGRSSAAAAGSTTARRSFGSTGFWEVGSAAAARQELLFELSTIRSMLPMRSYDLSPHFTPHGVQLMPVGEQAAGVDPLADCSSSGSGADDGGMLADSVKRKRKLAMKKHKYKKRMKKLRHQQ